MTAQDKTSEKVFKSSQPFIQFMTPWGERVIFIDYELKANDPKLIEFVEKQLLTDRNAGIYRDGEEPGAGDVVKNDMNLVQAQLDMIRKQQLEGNGGTSSTGQSAASNLGAAGSKSSAAMGTVSGGSSFQETPQQASINMQKLRERLAKDAATQTKEGEGDGKQPENGTGDSGKADSSGAAQS